MPPTDELVEVLISVAVGLVRAHMTGDSEMAAGELGRLLQATARCSNSLSERPDDEALRQAISRL